MRDCGRDLLNWSLLASCCVRGNELGDSTKMGGFLTTLELYTYSVRILLHELRCEVHKNEEYLFLTARLYLLSGNTEFG
jgi:hypothetical protein